MSDAPRLYTEDEVAKMLQLSTRTLRNLRANGEIAYHRLGAKIIRYSESDVREFLERHRKVDVPLQRTVNVSAVRKKGNSGFLADFEQVRAERKRQREAGAPAKKRSR